MLSLFGLSGVFNRDIPQYKSYKLTQFVDLIQNAPLSGWNLQNTKASPNGFLGEFVNSGGKNGYTNYSVPSSFYKSKIKFKFFYRRGKFCDVSLEIVSLVDNQVALVSDSSLSSFLNLLIKRSFPFIPSYLKEQMYGSDAEPEFVLG